MNELQSTVLNQLKTGHANAIRGSILAKRLGFKNDRTIRIAIRELIEARHPILSAVKPPYGYFFAETQKEVKDCLAVLQSRLEEDARRKSDTKLACAKILKPEQLKMPLRA